MSEQRLNAKIQYWVWAEHPPVQAQIRHKRRLPTGFPPTSEVVRQVEEEEEEFLFATALT
jgi:hypothetical protein